MRKPDNVTCEAMTPQVSWGHSWSPRGALSLSINRWLFASKMPLTAANAALSASSFFAYPQSSKFAVMLWGRGK
eukprot:5490220-Amphidinium_carterae.1